MKKENAALLVLFILLFSSFVMADIIYVPGDYDSIQEGLDAANSGDTISVAAGTYTENITWPATNGIQLIGEDRETTIIDGSETASVIRFENDLGGIIDSTTLISSFTIQNGDAQGGYPDYYGGGIYCYYSSPSLENVTITDNSASSRGGGMYCGINSNPVLVNCILWNNSPQEIYYGEGYDPNSITIAYSDIQGGEEGIVTNSNGTVYWETGNIDADPLFADAANGDYHLTEDSPCIDAGDPDSPLDPDGTIADMGAFYFDQTGIEDNYELQSINFGLNNYPNPFHPATTIEFSLHNDSQIELTLYNAKGQRIISLADNDFNKGDHSVIWNGKDDTGNSVSSGIYFYKLNVNSVSNQIRKCILMK